MKLKEIAGIIGGEIKGNPDLEITGVSGIFDAKAGDITFISSPKYLREIGSTSASCIIVSAFVDDTDLSQVRVPNPHLAFVDLLEHFYVKPSAPTGVSPLAFVSETATLGKDISIHPFAYVSDGASVGDGSVLYPGVFIGADSSVGKDTLIYQNVVIRENVRIGDRVRIHPGTVIGADGFGYVQQDGRHRKIPQVGGVLIGDDVEIGANTTIDRATTGDTVVGAGTKIDNLVQIGHNVKIGQGCIIVAQVALGGSARIGNGVVLGGQAAVADHSEVQDGAMFAGKSGVHGRVKRGVYSGIPAIDHRTWLRASSLYSRLPEMHNELKELRKKIEELERRQQA